MMIVLLLYSGINMNKREHYPTVLASLMKLIHVDSN